MTHGQPARSLDGRVAIVTGASRGIGAASARALAAEGARVVLAARAGAALTTLAADICACGGSALAVPTDVTQPDSVSRMVEQTLGACGRLDGAVNAAAGGGHRPTPLADVSIADFDSAIAVGLRGVFLAMRFEIAAMLGTGGSIVNISSTAGSRPVAGLPGYVAAKAALDGLTRTAALDYARRGIRINALAPGPVHTEQLEQIGPAARERAAAAVPMGRLGRPDEIARAAVWLCSPASSFVTGSTLTIDGGLLAGMPPFTDPKGHPMTGPDIAKMLQDMHLDRLYDYLPGMPEVLPALFGMTPEAYTDALAAFDASARAVAEELLAGPAFVASVDGLPFADGQTVLAVGDSITDDAQGGSRSSGTCWSCVAAACGSSCAGRYGSRFRFSISSGTRPVMSCELLHPVGPPALETTTFCIASTRRA